MRQMIYNTAMAAAFLSMASFAIEAVDARGRGGGGGARGGASTSVSRGGGASSHGGGGAGFSRGGSYSKPSGRASASQLPSGSGNRVNRGNNSISGGNTNISGGNTNINRGNTNINTGNVNNIHIDNDYNGYGGWHDYPVAGVAAVRTAAVVTAAALGTRYYALPPSCARYPWHSYTYYYCGGVYYQPQYQGDTIVYITVAKPQ